MNDTHQMHGKWHDVILQPTNGETFSHLMSYNIRGLQPAAVYEAIVQAKNRYGWNEVTDAYQFYTRGLGHDIYGKLFASWYLTYSPVTCPFYLQLGANTQK